MVLCTVGLERDFTHAMGARNMRWIIASLIVAAMALTLVTPAQAVVTSSGLILQVPDWNQPNPVQYPNDGLPAKVAGMDAYSDWCSPTAGANIMGYWEDVKGYVGLTDRQAFNATTNYRQHG